MTPFLCRRKCPLSFCLIWSICFSSNEHYFYDQLNQPRWKIVNHEAIDGFSHPHHGPGRGSMITGKSVHNQRIERLWRDLFYQVACFFYHLESCNMLDPDNNVDLFALHYAFIPCINKCLTQFVQFWNAHILSGTGGKTPMQMWIEGQLQMGSSQRGSVFEDLTEVISTIVL